MNIEYSYDSMPHKFFLRLPHRPDALITGKSLFDLLLQDGASLDAHSVLSYFNPDCNAFCKINYEEPLALKASLRILIRTPPNRAATAIHERLDSLEVSVKQLQRRLEQLEEPFPMQKIVSSSSFKDTRQDVDIFMLHASPLVEKSAQKETSLLDSTLNFEEERRLLITTLENNSLGAGLRFEAATNENLCEALSIAPKVLHISCHGNYNDHKKFYLAFESTTLGLLDKIDSERLHKLLTTKQASTLVFVSACYSDAITQVYLEAGFQCVVAVQSDCKIHDEAAKTFAREFYVNLLRGESIRKAFEGAKVLTEDTAKSITTCCCTHNHKAGCQWLQLSHTNTRKAHRRHTPDCTTCPEAKLGHHHASCSWAKDFLEVFNPTESNKPSLVACCCSPELPHNEGQKFVLLSLDPAYEAKVLFPEGARSEIEIFNAPIEDRRPPNVLNEVLGRNVEIKNLVQLLAGTGGLRCVSVFGAKGVGKSQVVMKAVAYAYERHVFKHGVVYLDFRGKTDVSRIYSRIANKLMMPGVSKKAQLVKALSSLSLCIVIDNVDSLFVEDFKALMVKVRHLLEEIPGVKFVVVAERPLNDTFVANFEVKALDSENAWFLLKHLAGSNLIKDRNDMKLDPQIWNRVTKTPSVLLQLASQLKQKKRLRELCQEFSQPESQMSQEAIMEMSMEKLCLSDSRYRELIIYLSCFPSGFYVENLDRLEEGLQEVFLNMCNFTSSNDISWAVNQEQPNFYTLREDVRSFVLDFYEPRDHHLAVALDHLATLARHFLKLVTQRKHNLDVHLLHFSPILNYGMWRAALPAQDFEMELAHFKLLEHNFLYYIDPKRLQNELHEPYCQSLRFFTAFKELTLCTIALLGTLEDIKSSQVVLKKAEQVCRLFAKDLHFKQLLAQLRLMKAWLRIIEMKSQEGVSCKSVDKDLNTLYDSFHEDTEGSAERSLLAGLHKRHTNSAMCVISSLNKTVAQWFDEAAAKFREIHNEVGEARAVLEREHWRLKQGLSDDNTPLCLRKAQIAFRGRGLTLLANEVGILKCTYLLQSNQLPSARKKIERLCQPITLFNERQKATISDLQTQVCDRLSKDSLHKFVFLRAYPLVCKDRANEQYSAVGNLCRLSMNYRNKLERALKKTDMYVCLRFNIANHKNLKRYIEEGCRILQLSSEVHDEDSFILEGKHGECSALAYSDLAAQICKLTHQIEVIVLAMPNSTKGAKVLVDGKAAKFSVGFDFPQYTGEVFSVLRAYEKAILLFCSSFYTQLQKGLTVQDAFVKALNKMDKYLHSAQLVDSETGTYQGKGPVLYACEDVDASSEHFQGLSAGLPIIDIPETSFESYYKSKTSCFVGRQVEMYKCMTRLKELRCVQLLGQEGVGKTAFAYQIAKYLSKRNLYRGGIHVYNFYKKNIREAEVSLIETGLFRKVDNDFKLQVKFGQVLLVFDNCNDLDKQGTTFQPWLQNLMQNEALSLILVKRRGVSEGLDLTLTCLEDPKDSAALLLTFLGTSQELLCSKSSRKYKITQLTEDSRLIKQRGNPRNIEVYSKEFDTKIARSLSSSPRNRFNFSSFVDEQADSWRKAGSASQRVSYSEEDSFVSFEDPFETPKLLRQHSESATNSVFGFTPMIPEEDVEDTPVQRARKMTRSKTMKSSIEQMSTLVLNERDS
jgi:Ni2+-binding GTPase involved in maturation of urease and hydrogenase